MSREDCLNTAKSNIEEAISLIDVYSSNREMQMLRQYLINPYSFILAEWGALVTGEKKQADLTTDNSISLPTVATSQGEIMPECKTCSRRGSDAPLGVAMIKPIQLICCTAYHNVNHYECQEMITKINEIIAALNNEESANNSLQQSIVGSEDTAQICPVCSNNHRILQHHGKAWQCGLCGAKWGKTSAIV